MRGLWRGTSCVLRFLRLLARPSDAPPRGQSIVLGRMPPGSAAAARPNPDFKLTRPDGRPAAHLRSCPPQFITRTSPSRRRGRLAAGPRRGRGLGPAQRPPPERQHPYAHANYPSPGDVGRVMHAVHDPGHADGHRERPDRRRQRRHFQPDAGGEGGRGGGVPGRKRAGNRRPARAAGRTAPRRPGAACAPGPWRGRCWPCSRSPCRPDPAGPPGGPARRCWPPAPRRCRSTTRRNRRTGSAWAGSGPAPVSFRRKGGP